MNEPLESYVDEENNAQQYKDFIDSLDDDYKKPNYNKWIFNP